MRNFLRKRLAAFLAGCLVASPLEAQQVKRAIPLSEPPTPPAVPFDFDQPAPPAEKPRPPKPAATPAESSVAPATQASDGTITYTTPDEVQLNYANGLYAQKLYEVAAPEYEKYLGQFPNAADRQPALFRLAESYRALGNSTAARNTYETLLAAFQSGDFVGPAAYRLADIYFREQNFSGALPLFRRAAIRVKDPAVALSAKFYTARCLENQRVLSEARGIYEEIVAIKGDNPFREASRFSLAQILMEAGRKTDAIKHLDSLAIETDKPQLRAEALIKSALLKIDLNDPEKAAFDLNRALKIPDLGAWKGVAQFGLLKTLFQSGKYQEVISAYETGSAEFPADAQPEMMLLAATAYRQTGNHERARKLYAQLAADYPTSSFAKSAQYERLVSLYSANDPSLIAEVDAYLAQNSEPEKHDQVILLKAEALYKQGRFAEAAPVYATLESSRLARNLKAEAQFKLGWCCMQAGDFDAAIKAFTAFLRQYPGDKLIPSVLVQRAIGYQRTKNYAAALTDFDELISKYQKAKERELALEQKALILGQQQDNAAMADTFRQLLRDYPKTAAAPQANYWIGWAAFEAKDYKSAIGPLAAARDGDREQFFERAALRIILSHYYLEERDALAKEVELFEKGAPKAKVPDEVLRWLGGQFFTDKNYESAETYFAKLTQREGDAAADDWLNLGRSQLEQKKYKESITALQTYLDLVKQPVPQATGYLALGGALLGMSKFDDAQKAADQACSLQPEGRLNALGRTLSGDIARARGADAEAAKIFLSISVIIDDPEITPRALEKAWQALNAAGDEKQAAKTLNELQSRYPEYPVKPAQAH